MIRTTAEKAARIFDLQRGRTSRREEREIEEIFLATTGLELTELKNRIDFGDDHYDLQQLIYHDIDDSRRQRSIVEHIRTQAEHVRSTHGRVGIKVVSDIDDTIYPNYADQRAWQLADQTYPGITQLYRALAGDPPEGTANIVLISARPYDRRGWLENHGTRGLKRLGFPDHTTLSGNLWTLLAGASDLTSRLYRFVALDRLAVSRIGRRKLENFIQWIDLMGEYDVVISGDRTQADHDFAHAALTHPKSGSQVLAGFIHDVGSRPVAEHPRLYLNHTVLGHALDAHAIGLIDSASLATVLDAVESRVNVYPPELANHVAADLDRARRALE